MGGRKNHWQRNYKWKGGMSAVNQLLNWSLNFVVCQTVNSCFWQKSWGAKSKTSFLTSWICERLILHCD